MEAAIAYADEFGITTLTLKALGQALGASTTAVYRYFTDKDDLVLAMREALLLRAIPPLETAESDPIASIVGAAQAYRSTVREHPCLSHIMALPAKEGTVSAAVPRLVVSQLQKLGLSGQDLVRGYQQIESFVVGTAMFDFADAPRHLIERQERFVGLDVTEVAAVLNTPEAVQANNEAAFEASLRAILASLSDGVRT